MAFCANAFAEGLIGQPDQAVAVGRQLRRLRMGRSAIEDVCDLLALVGRERGDIDQRLNALWISSQAMTAPA